MVKYLNVKNISEIKPILDSINTEEYSLVNYLWTEYGFLPVIFNEMFIEYFKNTGPKIGFCFPGHEIFYEKYVDILVTLDGFIDTTRSYKNNKETELLINNFKTISDKGIAFWYTVRNFDEDEYQSIFDKYSFRNVLFPIGKDLHWKLGWPIRPGYKYAEGKDGSWYTPQTEWNQNGSIGWDIDLWDDKIVESETINLKKFNCFFVKNSWKTRNYGTGNIEDLLIHSENKNVGSIEFQLYNTIIQYHIKNKINLIVINDLIKFPKIHNEYIHYVDMEKYFDVRLLLTISNRSDNFISSGTGPQDLSLYYSNTNQIVLTNSDIVLKKTNFFEKIQNIRNKKCFFYDMRSTNIQEMLEFLKISK